MNMSVQLVKHNNKPVMPYLGKISYLYEENINEILGLHPILKETLKDDDMFYFDDYNFYKYQLDRGGIMLGCYIDNHLTAYGVMIFPGNDEENLGYDLNFNQDELQFVAHLDSFLVHPDYRGNKLQYKLCTLMQKIALQKGYKHLCSTVSPRNIHSLNNLMNFGFEIRLEKLKYGGKLRYILYKSLSCV
jgi:predicted GNAT superfamily acetyltransferase